MSMETSGQNNFYLIVGLAIVVMVVILAMTTNLADQETIIQDSSVGSAIQNNASDLAEPQTHQIDIGSRNFRYSIEEIRANKGDTIRLILSNQGGTHDWVVDEFNAQTKIIGPGETDTIEFVVDKTGEFEYYCSVGSHRAMGMVGKLIVE